MSMAYDRSVQNVLAAIFNQLTVILANDRWLNDPEATQELRPERDDCRNVTAVGPGPDPSHSQHRLIKR